MKMQLNLVANICEKLKFTVEKNCAKIYGMLDLLMAAEEERTEEHAEIKRKLSEIRK